MICHRWQTALHRIDSVIIKLSKGDVTPKICYGYDNGGGHGTTRHAQRIRVDRTRLRIIHARECISLKYITLKNIRIKSNKNHALCHRFRRIITDDDTDRVTRLWRLIRSPRALAEGLSCWRRPDWKPVCTRRRRRGVRSSRRFYILSA